MKRMPVGSTVAPQYGKDMLLFSENEISMPMGLATLKQANAAQ